MTAEWRRGRGRSARWSGSLKAIRRVMIILSLPERPACRVWGEALVAQTTASCAPESVGTSRRWSSVRRVARPEHPRQEARKSRWPHRRANQYRLAADASGGAGAIAATPALVGDHLNGRERGAPSGAETAPPAGGAAGMAQCRDQRERQDERSSAEG